MSVSAADNHYLLLTTPHIPRIISRVEMDEPPTGGIQGEVGPLLLGHTLFTHYINVGIERLPPGVILLQGRLQ